VFLCLHIIKNFRNVLSFGYTTRLYFTGLCLVYALILGFSYRLRIAHSLKLREELRSNSNLSWLYFAEDGEDVQKQSQTRDKAWCATCPTHSARNFNPASRTDGLKDRTLEEFQKTESEWVPLLVARREILAFYHTPICARDLDQHRVAELLSRAVDKDEKDIFLASFIRLEDGAGAQENRTSVLRSFVDLVCTDRHTFLAWIKCYEYLAVTFPYDVLYPYSSPEAEEDSPLEWRWSRAMGIALWIYILGAFWIRAFGILLKLFP
jgi:hypothetical protein